MLGSKIWRVKTMYYPGNFQELLVLLMLFAVVHWIVCFGVAFVPMDLILTGGHVEIIST